MNNFQLSKNFNLREFQCRCCSQAKVSSRLVERLQQLRDRVGVPVMVTSGYRCPTHNRNVGGAPNSFHPQGLAADVRTGRHTPRELARLGEQLGFNGIGIYSNFVHLDLRSTPARW